MCRCIAVRGNHNFTGGSILISLRKKLNLISMSDVYWAFVCDRIFNLEWKRWWWVGETRRKVRVWFCSWFSFSSIHLWNSEIFIASMNDSSTKLSYISSLFSIPPPPIPTLIFWKEHNNFMIRFGIYFAWIGLQRPQWSLRTTRTHWATGSRTRRRNWQKLKSI
jgi:hypothetical protein